jgi:putative porin
VHRIVRSLSSAALLVIAAASFALPARAEEKEKEQAKEEPTLSDIVNVLHDKGLIDDDEHAKLAAKAAKEEAKSAWTDRISVWGDLRARLESFDYDEDVYSQAAGIRLHDRTRGRYRARLGVGAKVLSRASVAFQLASGGADPRSGNQTLGSGNDFDKDEIRIDLAYATLSPFPDSDLPGVEHGLLAVDIGKVRNPFIWKELGLDNLLFDNDINPEGANLRVVGGSGPVLLFGNGGVYVIDENATSKDPMFAAVQLGGTVQVADHVSVGARAMLYDFFSLDDDFFARGASNLTAPGGTGGNIIDGLARRDNSIQVVETSGFLNVGIFELFPVLVFGSYANNLSARPSLVSPGTGEENDAWAAGIFVGDKRLLVRVGFAYYYVEANAFPSMYLDSDMLDGTPNRQGYQLTLERELFENVDLVLRGSSIHRIEGGTAFANSGSGSDRLRGQADLIFKF